MRILLRTIGTLLLLLPAPAAGQTASSLPVIPHVRWQTTPPLGHVAAATRRNLHAGDSLVFEGLVVTVVGTTPAAPPPPTSRSETGTASVRVRLAQGSAREERTALAGSAFNWRGFHLAVVAIYGPGELGAGLVALEVGTLASLPPHVAAATIAGGADLRLRIPHRITHVTLHHTGDTRPLLASDDAAQRLRNLQAWGARERNWWDVPYHFLLGLEGTIYEGRDWRFMGETNTTYDPRGHFLISMIGNYDQQQPTPAQVEAIADLMAWAIRTNGLTVDAIGGHYHYAQTGCPGKYLRPLLEDGTLRRLVAARLAAR